MPSQRAILVDIHDMKLDPSVAYTQTKSRGHLAAKKQDSQQAAVSDAKKQVVEANESFIDVTLDEPVIDIESDFEDTGFSSKKKSSKKNKF